MPRAASARAMGGRKPEGQTIGGMLIVRTGENACHGTSPAKLSMNQLSSGSTDRLKRLSGLKLLGVGKSVAAPALPKSTKTALSMPAAFSRLRQRASSPSAVGSASRQALQSLRRQGSRRCSITTMRSPIGASTNAFPHRSCSRSPLRTGMSAVRGIPAAAAQARTTGSSQATAR